MTNPTADAAKLLRMLEEANGVLRSAYQIATRGGLDTNWPAFKTTVENILTIQHEAGIRWNTRPQPAAPAGEPDFQRIINELRKFADPQSERGIYPMLLEKEQVAVLIAGIDRLGLAARHKVEDADTENFGPGSWRRLLAQLREAKSKLAEREAELARADAVIAHSSGKDVIALDHWYAWQTEAEIRHAARQQQKASDEPIAKEGE